MVTFFDKICIGIGEEIGGSVWEASKSRKLLIGTLIDAFKAFARQKLTSLVAVFRKCEQFLVLSDPCFLN